MEDKEDKEEFDEQGRIDDITDAPRDFALQLPCALLLVLGTLDLTNEMLSL